MRAPWKIATALLVGMVAVAGAAAAASRRLQCSTSSLSIQASKARHTVRGPTNRRALCRSRISCVTGWRHPGELPLSILPRSRRKPKPPICGPATAATQIFANQLGADFAVSGWVQKVSNLILNMNIIVRDAKTARVDIA